jgi:quinol monooxygenase YgiN
MRFHQHVFHQVIVVALVAVSVLFVSRAPAQEKPNPIVAKVKASLKDPTKPFTMLVHLQVKDGTGAKFEAAFAKAIKATRQEKGCLAYDLNRDAKTPTRYVVYERWQNLAALEAHLQAAHFATLMTEIGDLLAAPPDVQVVLVPVGE